MMELYVLAVCLFCVGYWFWNYARLSKNLPPGPLGMPILGYIPFMDKNQLRTFSKLKTKYGEIFSFYLGQQLFVVLSSYAIAKEALIKQGSNFAGRPHLLCILPPEFKETKGIGVNSGKLFNEFKQAAVSVIKTFSRSDGNGESIITNEIQYTLREIDQCQGKPIPICELISNCVTNIMWFCLFAERPDRKDDKFNDFLHNTHKRAESFQAAGIELAFPQIFNIPFVGNFFQASTAIDSYRRMHDYFTDKINQTETSQSINEFNFVHEWVKLHPKDSANYNFYRNQLAPVISDLFTGGIETTASHLQWAILYMMEYPDIQKRVQTEINEVIGKHNKPTMMDKNKMPYTEATIMEVHRMLPVIPISIPHLNTKTSTVNGFTIPENSIVLLNIWEIQHNPETFPNPEEFRPERFLENGEFKRNEESISFSMGKRQCPGEALARMELFLVFTSMLQRYTFKKLDGVQSDLSYDFAAVVIPRPYKVIAIPNK